MKTLIKKTSLIAMASLFCLSMSLGNISYAAESPYSDVRANTKFMDALLYLRENNIMKGYEDGTFKPSRTINRAEALKIIFEARGIEVSGKINTNPFPDVPASEWYAAYVEEAKENNIIKGYDDGTYRPTQAVNRVEFVKMALSAQEFFDLSEAKNDSSTAVSNEYSDLDTGQWYMPYLAYGFNKGLLKEQQKPKGTFKPTAGMTRADAAYMIYLIALKNDEEKNSDSHIGGFIDHKKNTAENLPFCTTEENCFSGMDVSELLDANTKIIDGKFMIGDLDESSYVGRLSYETDPQIIENIKNGIKSSQRSTLIINERKNTPVETKHKVDEIFPEWYERVLGISGGQQVYDEYLDMKARTETIVDKDGVKLTECDCQFEIQLIASYNRRGYEPFDEWIQSEKGKEVIYDLVLRFVR